MNMIVQGEVGPKGVKDHQKGRLHLEPVLCQCQDRIGGRPEEQVQGCPLVLVHDRTKIMRQCEHEMEVRDPGDHFRLPEGGPLLFIQAAAAGTVAVSAGTGTHPGASAGITADQRISQLPGLAGDQGIHDLEFAFRHLMIPAVIRKRGCKKVPQDMPFTTIFVDILLQYAFRLFRRHGIPCFR